VKSWICYYNPGGTLKEKWEFEAGKLLSRELYTTNGLLQEEFTYNQTDENIRMDINSRMDKDIKDHRKFLYDRKGLLLGLELYNGKSELRYSERFAYHSSGMLREIFRLLPDGSYQITNYNFGSGKLYEERYGDKESFYINRFDTSGHLVLSETWQKEKLITTIKREYAPSGSLVSFVEEDLQKGTTVVKNYNPQGQLLGEARTGQKDDGTVYTYDDKGHVLNKYKKDEQGAEEWRYEYDEKDEVKKEIFLRRGAIEKITYYTSGTNRYEEIFRNNAIFLRVYYEKDEKVKDEFISGGEVVSERLYK
jgi:hypothetical protein